MIKPHKLLDRIIQGHYQNISFNDFVHLLNQLGFIHRRTTGSHMIFKHPVYQRSINVQQDQNKNAKPAQVKELKEFINSYRMNLGD
ncbi:MAG: type II toxin-antitoxin system HicA family toxin [Rhodospirillaceae bacterium]|nr:type II toxin-antitoxin system HicA family toxin [Rhodospirillaceae bacterium]